MAPLPSCQVLYRALVAGARGVRCDEACVSASGAASSAGALRAAEAAGVVRACFALLCC